MSDPTLTIDAQGTLSANSAESRHALRQRQGEYRMVPVGEAMFLVPSQRSQMAPRQGEALAFAGDLESMPLVGLLNLLGQNRETGRLVIQRGGVERTIVLRDGDVAAVASTDPKDRLGQFLLRLGKVSEIQIDEAMSSAERTGTRLGKALVEGGAIDSHDLWAAIQSQITDIFGDVVQWEDGGFILYRLPEEHRFPSTPPLSMQGLLLEAVRRADELGRFREKIPNAKVRVQLTGKALKDGAEDIDRRAFHVLSSGGTMNIEELARQLRVSEFDAMSAAWKLLRSKCIEVLEEEAASVATYELSPADAEKLEVYNLAFREIRDEVVRNGKLDAFTVGVMRFMSDPKGTHAALFKGMMIAPNGALPVDKLVKNVSAATDRDHWTVIQDGLNELTFFMLFQCGEHLDPQSDENLGRRVRLIHSALSGSLAI